jgi:hypothetical protein
LSRSTSTSDKDLIDIILIREMKAFELERLQTEGVRVFEARETLPPASLPLPPREWAQPYRALAENVGVDPDVGAGHQLAAGFFDPVLASQTRVARWDTRDFEWRRNQ